MSIDVYSYSLQPKRLLHPQHFIAYHHELWHGDGYSHSGGRSPTPSRHHVPPPRAVDPMFLLQLHSLHLIANPSMHTHGIYGIWSFKLKADWISWNSLKFLCRTHPLCLPALIRSGFSGFTNNCPLHWAKTVHLQQKTPRRRSLKCGVQ